MMFIDICLIFDHSAWLILATFSSYKFEVYRSTSSTSIFQKLSKISTFLCWHLMWWSNFGSFRLAPHGLSVDSPDLVEFESFEPAHDLWGKHADLEE